MTTTPPAGPQPEPRTWQTPPYASPAPSPAPHANGNGSRWVSIGTAIGAALSIAGAAFSTFYSGGANRSAQTAIHEVAVTQEMLDKARDRAAKLEERLDKLEQWQAAQEAEERVRREGSDKRSQ